MELKKYFFLKFEIIEKFRKVEENRKLSTKNGSGNLKGKINKILKFRLKLIFLKFFTKIRNFNEKTKMN